MERDEAIGRAIEILGSPQLDQLGGPTSQHLLLLNAIAEALQVAATTNWNAALNRVIDDLLKGEPTSFPSDARGQVAWLRAHRIPTGTPDLEKHNQS
jgi:hypothetical protein